MCIQFRSYLRGARFTLRTDHKSLVWLHRFKDTEGMLSRWLHSLQQFQFSIIRRPGKDHGNADGLSRVPSSPCRQCTLPDCPPATLIHHDSTNRRLCLDRQLGGSRFVPVQSGEDWIARLDDDLSRPSRLRVIRFVSRLYRRRIRCAWRCMIGWWRMNFRLGRR